jgi:DNA-binding IclR family transcriptional regulator
VWRALNGRTVAELATLLDLKQTSVAKHLAKLGAHELAACDSAARWRRLDNLDAVAKD